MEVLTSSPLSPSIINKALPTRKHNGKVKMITNSQIQVKKALPILQIRTSPRNKVFEDQAKGIVCYRDDNGEITCEGYDEGPRIHQQLSKMNYHSRDAEMVGLLQKSWLQIVKEGGLRHEDKGFNWNGFNNSC
ncbi:hypothetical protein NMG60_11005897 [Bertholletia excelsa]